MSKLSEILLTALFSGIVAAFTVGAAYLFGMRQSDKNWKRELSQRDKEQEEQERKAIISRRIDSLLDLHESISVFLSYVSDDRGLNWFSRDSLNYGMETLNTGNRVLPMFPAESEPETNQIIREMNQSFVELLPIVERYNPGHIPKTIPGEKSGTRIDNPRYKISENAFSTIKLTSELLLRKTEDFVKEFD